MASRQVPTLIVVFVLAFLAIFPGLYALQVTVHRLRGRPQLLTLDLEDRLDNQEPSRLAIALRPAEEPSAFIEAPGGMLLRGAGRLVAPVYPWRETMFLAEMGLDLRVETLLDRAGPLSLSTERGEFLAWYQEHFVGSSRRSSPKVPCQGILDLRDLAVRQQGDSTRLQRFSGEVGLTCTSFGRDMSWGTPDDLHWRLAGSVELGWARGDSD